MSTFSQLTTIRAAIATRIVTVDGYTVANVKQDKHTGDPVASLPFVTIQHRDTEREPLSIGATRSYRNISIIEVDLHADKGTAANLQENLDTQSGLIATAVLSSRTLTGACFDVELTGINDELSSEADKPRGCRTLTFAVEWHQQTTN